MSVYKHNYRAYTGRVTPLWTRILVLARYGLAEVWSSKITIGLFTLSFLPTFVFLILIYLANNPIARALILHGNDARDLSINSMFFLIVLEIQCWAALVITAWIAPRLITFDLADNALPILLSHPISRFGYVLGKFAALFGSLSLVTWVPCLLLFVYQGYSSAQPWAAANLHIASGLLFGSALWILHVVHPRAGALFVGQMESRGHRHHHCVGVCSRGRGRHCQCGTAHAVGIPAQYAVHHD